MEVPKLNTNSIEKTLGVVGRAFVLSKTWKLILIAIAGVAAVVYLIYRAGKKSGEKESIDYNQIPLPGTGVTVTQAEVDEYKNFLKTTASRLADSLYINLGFTLTNGDLEKTLQECIKLPDYKIIGLNNVYNAKYLTKRASLLQDLKAKTYLYYSADNRDNLVNRLEIIGAK